MAERRNGRGPTTRFERGTYGTERQGVSVDSGKDTLNRLEQSRKNKGMLIAALIEKRLKQDEPEEDFDDIPVEVGNKELPIFGYKQEIVETVRNNRASIFISETGGGKSTQIPQFLMEAGSHHVFVLQQRRVMVDGLDDRLQVELTSTLGQKKAANLVGAVHGKRTSRHKDNKITPATAAAFVHMLPDIERECGDKDITIILDEIHEDNSQMEVAAGLVGMAAQRHPKWRFCVMSATIDPEPLKIPLGRITNFDNPQSVEVPVIRIEGRPHNIEMREEPELNPAEAFLAHGEGHLRSILATRGFKQLDTMKQVVREGLEAQAPGSSGDIIFRKYSSKTSTEQRAEIANLAENLPEGKRLVVLGTPALKSGITIPGVTFVATDGMINREKLNDFNAEGLIAEYASRAEIIQVIGRGGRDVDGGVGYLCLPMPRDTKPSRIKEFNSIYPYMSFDERDEYALPEIFNTDLAQLLLMAVSNGADLEEFNKFIINEQAEKRFNNAISRLRDVFGALDEDGRITEIGKLMNGFPVKLELSRGIAEAVRGGRPQQHLARMAMIAGAVDAGGLQDFHKNRDEALWRPMLSDSTSDDFFAQLDMMIALQEEKRENPSENELYLAYLHDLDPSRVKSSNDQIEKMLKRLSKDRGLRAAALEAPSGTEITALREDFTAGMFDRVQRQAGKDDKGIVFAHVHDAKHEQVRTLAEHSAMVPGSVELLAGFPVFYERIKKGKKEEYHEITMALSVNPSVVGRYAIQNGLVDYVPVRGSARVNNGNVQASVQPVFGTMDVGSHRSVTVQSETIPKESQATLVEYIQKNPGPELLALRELAKELAEYRRIMPADELKKYRRADAPVDFTEGEAMRIVRHFAQYSHNAGEIDVALANYSAEHNISADLYYDATARKEIIERSPATVQLGNGSSLEVRYDNGNPYVAVVTKAQEAYATQAIYLDDGREVLRRVRIKGKRGPQRVSFGFAIPS